MKKAMIFATCLLFALPAFGQNCPVPDMKSVQKTDPVPLCLVVEKVKQALDDYNNDPTTAGSALPALSSADFDFKVARATTSGFKVSFFVFTLGTTKEVDSVDDVTFSYQVPPKKPGLAPRKTPGPDFSRQLVETIKAAAEQIRQTNSIGKANFKSLTITLAYNVKWDFNAGVAVPIELVTAGGSFDKTKASTQTVKLVFSK